MCSTKAASVSLSVRMEEGRGGGSEERREAKRKMGFPVAISSGLKRELGWGVSHVILLRKL